MKQLLVAMLLAAAVTLLGCSSNNNSTNPANINGTWNATLTDTNNATVLSFGTALLVNGDGTLNVTSFNLTTNSACFASGETETGSFTLAGNTNGNVSGKFGFVVVSGTPAGNTLTLTGTVSNGNTISGTWILTGTGCTGTGNFTMTKM